MLSLTVGDRAPPIIGANADGRFYSQDAQAGRPVMMVALGSLEPEAAAEAFARLMAFSPLDPNLDLLALAPFSARYASAFVGLDQASERIIHVNNPGVEALAVDGEPAVIVIDRGWRIVHVGPFTVDLARLYRDLRPRLVSEAPRICAATAPVLIIPNLLPPDACRGLIDHFEASPHRQGLMASVADGAAAAKLDEGKKRRRDIELAGDSPSHGLILKVLADRCAPEIKRAFQCDVVYADRILIARYDDTGGYFLRHRDNAAPQTAFRDFAVSINLNTDEYEGGELLFPEYTEARYSPPAGGAIVFSASLLHEAAPVTRGRRYVALSFLSTAAGQARGGDAGSPS